MKLLCDHLNVDGEEVLLCEQDLGEPLDRRCILCYHQFTDKNKEAKVTQYKRLDAVQLGKLSGEARFRCRVAIGTELVNKTSVEYYPLSSDQRAILELVEQLREAQEIIANGIANGFLPDPDDNSGFYAGPRSE